MISKNMLELIGNTPLVRLDRINPNPKVSIYAKLESYNPSGSLKDRIAKYMIESAEKKGLLDPKKTIIEATSGNTGIALGMVCAVKGYKCKLFMLESKSIERRFLLRYWGAELILTSKDDADSHIYAAKKLIAEEPDKYFYIDQNENEDNVLAHYNGTAGEIIKDLDGKVDVFIAGFGTGGMLMGVGRALRETKAGSRIISIEPAKAISKIDGLKFSGEGYFVNVDSLSLPGENPLSLTSNMLIAAQPRSAGNKIIQRTAAGGDVIIEGTPASGVYRLEGGYLYTGNGSLQSPALGDIRIQFSAFVENVYVTVFGKLQGDRIVPFMFEGEHKLYRAFTAEREEAVAILHKEYKTIGWILRIVGFIMMWMGLTMFFGPINAVLDVVPILGSVGRGIVSFVMFIVALILSLVTILISMIAHNLIALIITLVVIIGGGIFLLRRAKQKSPA